MTIGYLWEYPVLWNHQEQKKIDKIKWFPNAKTCSGLTASMIIKQKVFCGHLIFFFQTRKKAMLYCYIQGPKFLAKQTIPHVHSEGGIRKSSKFCFGHIASCPKQVSQSSRSCQTCVSHKVALTKPTVCWYAKVSVFCKTIRTKCLYSIKTSKKETCPVVFSVLSSGAGGVCRYIISILLSQASVQFFQSTP